MESPRWFYTGAVLPTGMSTSTSSPRLVTLLALLGLAPVAYYLLGTGRTVVALSLISVVIIAASLFLMTRDHGGQPT